MSELKTPKPTLDDTDGQPVVTTAPRDTDGTPWCPVHNCRMKTVSSGPKGSRKAYLKCPVPGCDETGVKVRKPPQNPTTCPRCEKGGKVSYCEKDTERSRRGMIVMICPVCGYSTPGAADPRMADLVPQFRKTRTQTSYGDR